jgi:hypothetical protein
VYGSVFFVFSFLKFDRFGMCRLAVILGSELEHLSARLWVAIRLSLIAALFSVGSVSLTGRSWCAFWIVTRSVIAQPKIYVSAGTTKDEGPLRVA